MTNDNRHSDDERMDDELMALARELPNSVAPDRDLWPGIEDAIQRPPQRSAWNSVWAQAAAVILLIGGSSGVTYVAMKGGAVEGPQVVTADNLFEPVSGDFGAHYSLGNGYLDAHNQLAGGLETKLDILSPKTRKEVIENLNTIRVAIKDINAALAKEPDNVLLQELLLSTYHEEVALMMKVDGIANSAMRREDI